MSTKRETRIRIVDGPSKNGLKLCLFEDLNDQPRQVRFQTSGSPYGILGIGEADGKTIMSRFIFAHITMVKRATRLIENKWHIEGVDFNGTRFKGQYNTHTRKGWLTY